MLWSMAECKPTQVVVSDIGVWRLWVTVVGGADCDAIIDKSEGENNVVNRRTEVVNLLQEVEKKNSLEAVQKAKIKWAIEGDENFKYYHDVINKKRNHLSIRGILVEVADLECQVSKEEIKKAVWDYGIDKSPGPDGFTFGFYRRYWKLIENDVVDVATCFFYEGSFPKGGNSSFISLIGSMYKIISKILANRLVVVLGGLVNEIQSAFIANKQILDGPFILNESVQWCKKKKKRSLVFKVDFKKAYDSVRWDHLDEIIRKFGFEEKWCMWIQSCLRSSRGSVIVNGSPTNEFYFYKGLKQGDPLSPVLFILVMKSLHISFQRVVDIGLFKGIELAPSLNLSYMFYADDAIFMGQWSESSIDTIVKVLDCFNRASGLRINMTKSKLLGISMEDDKVKQAAAKIGCNTLKTTFSYLGSKVGRCMSRIQYWNKTIKRMACRLSMWNLKTLSIGGKLTLLKSVLRSMPVYHMSLFKVPKKVLHRMESMRSHSFNGAELSSKKSVWRFITHGSSLWTRVIKALHGYDGKIGQKVKSCYPSLWLDIIHEVEMFKSRGIDLVSLIHSKLGNGANTSFWEVACRGGSPFKSLFPRLYVLETQKKIDEASKFSHSGLDVSFHRPPRGGVELQQFEHMKKKVEGCIVADMMDRWFWALEGSCDFTITSVWKMIDDFMLPDVSSKTLWIKAVPIKVNVHA
nr:RNA-directed DNA polymerase, eukaryota, reverse transcriptase zinc-binding domain protein [Tanacetum cinerariifolium]